MTTDDAGQTPEPDGADSPPDADEPDLTPPVEPAPAWGNPETAVPPYGTPPPYGQPPQYGQYAPYAQPGYGPYAPSSYGNDPQGRPYSDRTKLAAGLLQIFLGCFGVGRFYMGSNNIAVAQLLVTVLTCGVGTIVTVPWSIVDGIVILVGEPTDGRGRPLR